ncbi:MAG: CBS and ACT domain-containing protein [Deltaproteobacteria bacterium]|nr:CBS and ACT domain-containing protein [Deltaproteobacteria bacterium]
MLVKNWMSKKVVTIDARESMQNATALMKEHRIRMLPVLQRSKLVGIITDRDLKKASASDATSLEIHELLYLLTKIKIEEIMTRDPITVDPQWTVEETAQLLLDKKISGVPVTVADRSVVGVITQTDIFRVLTSLTGIENGGVQVACLVEDRPGSIKELADLIRGYGGQMVSILSSYDQASENRRKVYIRMRHIERSRMGSLRKELVENFDVRYIIDHTQNQREIFSE